MGIGRLAGSTFNLVMSVRHDASAARLDQWRQSFQRASEMIWDATDGQHQLGTIYVCNDSSGGRNADGWLMEIDGRSNAGGLGALGTETTHMTLWGDERFKPFVLCHELIHYLYGPADEYSGPGSDSAECLGNATATDACVMERGYWEGDRFGDDATGGPLVIGDFSELCVAGNHDADGDTWQDDVHAESCWETMVDAFPGLSIPSSTPVGPEPAGADPITWVLLAPEERFVVVIDRSGSMAGNKIAEARYGADWWCQQTLSGELLGVVSYAGSVSTPADHPLSTVTGQADRDAASAAVSTVTAGGATAMGDAMRAALEEFLDQGQRAATQVVVLLTDGRTNAGEHPASVLPDLVANGVRVYPIGIGTDVDTGLLEDVAQQTGGALYRIDPTLSQAAQETAIRDAMIDISGISRDGGGVVTTAPEAISEETVKHEVLIEKGSELATFGVSWPAGEALLLLRLHAPDGSEISVSDVPAGTRQLIRRDRWHGYEVEEPAPGTWVMEVQREFGKPGTAYRRFVFSRNRSIDGGVVVPRGHQPGAKVPISFHLYHDAPLRDVKLVATVTQPNGKAVEVTLEPTGQQDGCVAGTYEGWFATTKAQGVHTVTVHATAAAASHVVGGERLRDGEQPAAVTVPDFVRTFTSSFLVGEEKHPRFTVAPDSGEPGESLKVEVRGRGTAWSPRGTRVGFGDQVDVRDLSVLGPDLMVAEVVVSEKAAPGARTVTVSGPGRQGTLWLDEGFMVDARRADPRLRRPVDRVRLDALGRVTGALSGDQELAISEAAAEALLRLRRTGAAVVAELDEEGRVVGFDVG